ncbi:MAG: PIN domain-containing protein [Imperialibacter sp.]|uniref:type II toxin-antitoxin system VapC family toxin n=1 Tax=Imperialibacter sp. TaxID=2038411 RepID=UPI0032EC9C0D
MEPEVYLDTHVVVWLYGGEISNISPRVISIIEESTLYYSSFVRLELKYLFEIGKIKVAPDIILKSLEIEIALVNRDSPLYVLVNNALEHSWTRDPFDRMIVSQAQLSDCMLVTKDSLIRENFRNAVW